MPITNTQEVYEIRSISPQRINPSITEGEKLYTGVLGPDRAVSIVRYAPFFITAPFLIGDPGIPSILECSPGVADGSPSPLRTYKWFVDGVEVIGNTTRFFETNNTHDTKDITCQVRIYNILGEAFLTTEPITATVVEPIYVMSGEHYAVVGIGADDVITINNGPVAIVTGMWVDDYQTVFNMNQFAITGMAMQDHVSVNYFDIYAAVFPIFDSTMASISPEAGLGSWTTVSGTFATFSASGFTGSTVFRATGSALTKATRSITVNAAKYALVDAGNAMVSLDYYATSISTLSSSIDGVTIYLEAIDGTTSAVTRLNFSGENFPPMKGATNFWTSYFGLPVSLPPNTRTVRVVVELPGDGDGNDCQIDDISVKLWRTI